MQAGERCDRMKSGAMESKESVISEGVTAVSKRLTSMNFSLLKSKSWSSSTPRYWYFLKDRDAFLAAASSPVVYWSA